jgi:lysophospholipase L1-like esterase
MKHNYPQICFIAALLFFCIAGSAISQRTIVTIGDSNGAAEHGWVNLLKSIRTQDSIFNYSVAGNTIGFDNNGNEKLNTLKNIDQYLSDAINRSAAGTIDDVVILLGTNDCKLEFAGRGEEVLENLRTLVQLILSSEKLIDKRPEIYIVTPPPIGPDSVMLEKYHGGDLRLRKLLPGFLAVALDTDSHFIDVYHELEPDFKALNTDGIHLNEKGATLVAATISRFLDKTTKIQWDDTEEWVWPQESRVVEIASPIDGALQKAYFYPTASATPKPLIVSLHTWSGDYTQRDELVHQIIANDWNYIHPDFRGVNNTPKALGSKYAIDDIEQAITYAIKNASVDLKNIHVIGASGGGYSTLYTYMNSEHNINSFSAWVPISDIEAWYYQSAGRKNKYADHILAATSAGNSELNALEARKRSPIFMKTPVKLRTGSKLNIFAGIHDGYEGSVPVSQSVLFYNKVISDFGAKKSRLVSDREIIDLVSMRTYPQLPEEKIGERAVIFKRSYKNISLILFEGNHEMLTDVAIDLLPITHE